MMMTATTESVLHPYTRLESLKMVSGCRGRDRECEAKAIFDALHRRIAYRSETPGFDIFQSFRWTWNGAGGDCDCMSIAVAASLSVQGFDVAFDFIRQGHGEDANHHVFPMVEVPTPAGFVLMGMDISEDWTFAGWEPKPGSYEVRTRWIYDPPRWIRWQTGGRNGPPPMPNALPIR